MAPSLIFLLTLRIKERNMNEEADLSSDLKLFLVIKLIV